MTLAALLRHLASAPGANKHAPRPGARYAWDCGCQFAYTHAQEWEERTACTWHQKHRRGVTGPERATLVATLPPPYSEADSAERVGI